MEYFVVLSFSLLVLAVWLKFFGEKTRKSSKGLKTLGIIEACQFGYMAHKKARVIGKQRESRFQSIYNKFYSSKSGYSKKPLSVKIFGKTIIYQFFDYESIYKINTSDAFNDRTYDAVLELYSGGKPGGIGLNNTKYHWRELKRFAMKKLKQAGLGNKIVMTALLSDLLPELIERIENKQKESSNKIQVNDLFSVAILNAISTVVARKKFSEQDPDFIQWYTAVVESHNVHILRFFGIAITGKVKGLRELFGYTNLVSIREKSKQSIQNIIDARKRLGLYKDNPENFVDFFLQEIDKYKNDPHYKNVFSEHQLITTVQDLFIAGMETTSKFLESFIMFMCLYPDVQNKIHQEIDSVVGKNAFPIYYDYKSRMNYTLATMHEVHRLSNILPVIPRMTTRDVEIGGCQLKKGDVIASMMFSVRFDDSYWKEPTKFSPDRFLDDNGQIIQERVDRMLVFGAGPRVCVGENIAAAVAFTLAVGVLQKYTVKQQDDTEILSVNESFGATIGPHPFHISIFDR